MQSFFIIVQTSALRSRVSDPDPVFFHGSVSGSGFQISLDPDLGAQKKSAERAKRLFIRIKLKNYD